MEKGFAGVWREEERKIEDEKKEIEEGCVAIVAI